MLLLDFQTDFIQLPAALATGAQVLTDRLQ